MSRAPPQVSSFLFVLFCAVLVIHGIGWLCRQTPRVAAPNESAISHWLASDPAVSRWSSTELLKDGLSAWEAKGVQMTKEGHFYWPDSLLAQGTRPHLKQRVNLKQPSERALRLLFNVKGDETSRGGEVLVWFDLYLRPKGHIYGHQKSFLTTSVWKEKEVILRFPGKSIDFVDIFFFCDHSAHVSNVRLQQESDAWLRHQARRSRQRAVAQQSQATGRNLIRVSAIILHTKSLEKTVRLASLLSTYANVVQVIVWNNNPDVTLMASHFAKVSERQVWIVNSPSDQGDYARYLACAQSTGEACFFIDDTDNVRHVSQVAVLSKIFRTWPLRMYRVSSVRETETQLRLSAYNDRFSLAARYMRIGGGSLVPVVLVQRFLRQIATVGVERSSLYHSDDWFPLWTNSAPCILQSVQEAEDRKSVEAPALLRMDHALHILAQSLYERDALFRVGDSSPPDEKALCSRSQCVLLSSLDSTIEKASSFLPWTEKFRLKDQQQVSSERILNFAASVDGSLKSALHVPTLYVGSFTLTLDLLQACYLDSLTLYASYVAKDWSLVLSNCSSRGQTVHPISHQYVRLDEASCMLKISWTEPQVARYVALSLSALANQTLSIFEITPSIRKVAPVEAGSSLRIHARDGFSRSDLKRLLILVLVSAHNSVGERNVIRRAWKEMGHAHETFLIEWKFVACRHGDLEVSADLIQLNCRDHYDRLSEKVMMMFSWASAARLDGTLTYDFLAKTDFDVLVRLPLLARELSRLNPGRDFYWGLVHKEQWVNNDVTDKNSDPLFPLPAYPPYATGVFYVLSSTLVDKLARIFASEQMLLLQNEDQTVGVAISRLGVKPVHTTLLQQWSVCDAKMITIHPVPAEKILEAAQYGLHHQDVCNVIKVKDISNCPLCFEASYCQKSFPNGYAWWREWECFDDGAVLNIGRIGNVALARYGDRLNGPLDWQRLGEIRQSPLGAKFRKWCPYSASSCKWAEILQDESECLSVEDLLIRSQKSAHRRQFLFVWTTAADSFLRRHHRVLESVLRYHPLAKVRVFSNTLPCSMFAALRKYGFDVHVVRFEIDTLATNLPGQKWLARLEEWRRGDSFYAHFADYVRLVVLYHFGGIYMDTDMLLLNRVPQNLKNGVAIEHCDDLSHDFCMHLPEHGSSWSQMSRQNVFYTPNSMMVFQPRHRAVWLSLEEFDKHYDPAFWPCGTVYLSRAVRYLRAIKEMKPHEILSKHAFFPVSWQDASILMNKLETTTVWDQLFNFSIAIHLWNKMYSKTSLDTESFMFRLLEEGAMFDVHGFEKKKNLVNNQ